jgi:hypothetical protein
MPVQSARPDDGHDEERTPPKTLSDKRAAIGQCSIRIVSDDTGDVEILRAGAEPPLLLRLTDGSSTHFVAEN